MGEVREDGLGEEERTENVDSVLPFEVFKGDGFERGVFGDAGVVD